MLLTTDGKTVYVNPQSLEDISFLKTFPGFYKNTFPADRNVGRNLVQRLLSRKINFSFTPEVKNVINQKVSEDLPVDFKFHTEPLPFQRLALQKAVSRNNVGFLLDPGLGKTKVALDWLFLKKAKRIIVVCPSPLKEVWVEQIQLHRPEFVPYIIETTVLTRELEAAGDKTFLICSYRTASEGAGFLANWGPDSLIVDEALIKNPSSLRTRSLTQLSQAESIQYRAILSGTLINNDAAEVFAPVRLLERSLFGISNTVFNKEYFVFSRGETKFPVGLKKGVEEELREVLRSVSIIMRKEQYLSSLPPKHIFPIFVEISDVQQSLISQIREQREFSLPGKKPVIVKSQLTALGKLLQIENYFYYEPTDEEDVTLEDLFLSGENHRKARRLLEPIVLTSAADAPKPKRFRELSHQLGGKRGIIWFNFRAELPLILASLDDRYLVVDGNTKSPSKIVTQFNQDPNIRWLVAQARVLNYGVTVLGEELSEDEILPDFSGEVHVEIFFSVNFSYEVLVQQMDRIHRIGQKFPCEYYFLLADSVGERRVWEILQQKQNVREYMLASCL